MNDKLWQRQPANFQRDYRNAVAKAACDEVITLLHDLYQKSGVVGSELQIHHASEQIDRASWREAWLQKQVWAYRSLLTEAGIPDTVAEQFVVRIPGDG